MIKNLSLPIIIRNIYHNSHSLGFFLGNAKDLYNQQKCQCLTQLARPAALKVLACTAFLPEAVKLEYATIYRNTLDDIIPALP